METNRNQIDVENREHIANKPDPVEPKPYQLTIMLGHHKGCLSFDGFGMKYCPIVYDPEQRNWMPVPFIQMSN